MDCNITLNYARELMRMCQTYHTCTDCPLRLAKNCLDVVGINSYRIEAVQKWSDEHSEAIIYEGTTYSSYTNPDIKGTSLEWATVHNDSIPYTLTKKD